MKEKLTQFAADSTTAYTAGAGVNAVTGGNHQLLILLATVLAPVARDIIIKVFDYAIAKIKK